jgi:hydroxymethylglutaryl-CoA synthase
MRGILGWGVHLPRGRLDRSQITALVGAGGGKGTRVVASYDEDTTTMAVEAGRNVLRAGGPPPTAVWLATTTPAYLDKTTATAVCLRRRGLGAIDVRCASRRTRRIEDGTRDRQRLADRPPGLGR